MGAAGQAFGGVGRIEGFVVALGLTLTSQPRPAVVVLAQPGREPGSPDG